MDPTVESALGEGGIVDITTVGAKSGRHRRIEIVFHCFEGRFYITGKPGFKRDWMANLNANPEFTLHLKRNVTANLTAQATEITNEEERESVLYRILTESWDTEPDKAAHIVPRWVADAPLVEFTIT